MTMHRRLFVPAAAASAAGLLTAARAAAAPPPKEPITGVYRGDVKELTVESDLELTTAAPVAAPVVTKAVCVLMPVGDSGVSGTLHFEQVEKAVRRSSVISEATTHIKITGEVKGLTPGKHGFHVHQFGDITDMAAGKSAGGHMDVGEHKHGKPADAERHTGDLGNITADKNGVAQVEMTDSVISLNGAHSVVGRGFIVHAEPDDFGQPTGNAGARVAIGVIGVALDGLK